MSVLLLLRSIILGLLTTTHHLECVVRLYTKLEGLKLASFEFDASFDQNSFRGQESYGFSMFRTLYL